MARFGLSNLLAPQNYSDLQRFDTYDAPPEFGGEAPMGIANFAGLLGATTRRKAKAQQDTNIPIPVSKPSLLYDPLSSIRAPQQQAYDPLSSIQAPSAQAAQQGSAGQGSAQQGSAGQGGAGSGGFFDWLGKPAFPNQGLLSDAPGGGYNRASSIGDVLSGFARNYVQAISSRDPAQMKTALAQGFLGASGALSAAKEHDYQTRRQAVIDAIAGQKAQADLATAQAKANKGPAPINVSPGGYVLDPITHQIIFKAEFKPEAPKQQKLPEFLQLAQIAADPNADPALRRASQAYINHATRDSQGSQPGFDEKLFNTIIGTLPPEQRLDFTKAVLMKGSTPSYSMVTGPQGEITAVNTKDPTQQQEIAPPTIKISEAGQKEMQQLSDSMRAQDVGLQAGNDILAQSKRTASGMTGAALSAAGNIGIESTAVGNVQLLENQIGNLRAALVATKPVGAGPITEKEQAIIDRLTPKVTQSPEVRAAVTEQAMSYIAQKKKEVQDRYNVVHSGETQFATPEVRRQFNLTTGRLE